MSYAVRNTERGFTQIEVLVAMGIAGIVIAAIAMTYITQQKLYAAQANVTEMFQQTRAAMDMLSREIRMAGYGPTRASFDGVTYNTNTAQIQIKADLDGDGSTTGANENIIYSYDAANHRLDRNAGSGNQPVAENIQAFAIEYKKQDGSAATTSAEIRQIKITITGRTSTPDPNYPSNGGYRTYALTSLVTPTNLFYSDYTR